METYKMSHRKLTIWVPSTFPLSNTEARELLLNGGELFTYLMETEKAAELLRKNPKLAEAIAKW